ncbi:MAG TPA: helix-turn-helix transcriptional regulator [Myxococcota bacterium]|nr:helix-turn-helix transcriptional regulator [Myxococcota bacterium]
MGAESFLLGLIDHIYAAAVAPERWETVLAELSAALGDPAIYISLRIPGPRAERAVLSAPETDPGPVYRLHLDPAYHAVFMRLSTVGFPWATFDPEELSRRFSRTQNLSAAFREEFLRPQGLASEGPICHLLATVGGRPMAGMMIYRREGCRPIKDSELALLDRLVPHLQSAYAIHCRLAEAQHQHLALREVLDRFPSGVALLDEGLRVVFSNRSADLIFALDDGIRLENGRPRLSEPQQDRGFQQLLAEAVHTRAERGRSYGKTLSIVRSSGRRSFASMIGPLLAPPPGTNLREAAAILFVTDPDGSQISTTEVLQGLYDLTPAEAELLRLLAEGRSLEEVARQRGITMNTARGQLKQVFAKTDTRRQGELVRLVLTGVASLGDEGGR